MPWFHKTFSSSALPQAENIIIGNPVVAHVQLETVSKGFLNSVIVPLIPILSYVYLAGVVVMIVITVFSLARLRSLKKKAVKTNIHGIDVYIHDSIDLASFSWLNQIFICGKDFKQNPDALIIHELAHVRFHHYIDLILAQFVLVIQWFNPAVWHLKKQLQEVHEFQADSRVIDSGMDKYDYQLLLIKNISKGKIPVMVTGIKSGSLKKRFLMMRKTNFKSNWFSRSITVGLGILFGIILLKMPAVAEVVETKSPVLKENIVLIDKDNENEMVYHIDNVPVNYDQVKNFDSSKISCVEVFKGEQKVIGIVTKDFNKTKNIRGEKEKTEYEPLDRYVKKNSVNLDCVPSYEGGENHLKEELNRILSYSARYEIPGTTEIGFTVTAKGNIENIRICRSSDYTNDIIAIKAIKKLSGKWRPAISNGKPVAVDMVIPVTFNN